MGIVDKQYAFIKKACDGGLTLLKCRHPVSLASQSGFMKSGNRIEMLSPHLRRATNMN